MSTFDIILDDDSNPQELNGDFVTGENDNNLIYYNVVSHVGHYKTAPLIGGAINEYLNSNTPAALIERNLKSSLARDIFPNAEVNAKNINDIVINKTIVFSNGND
jgi:hypothetical protein